LIDKKPSRNSVIESIWNKIDPSTEGYHSIIELCLSHIDADGLEQIASEMGGYLMSRTDFDNIVRRVISLLQKSGVGFNQSEYASFVGDVIARLELEISDLNDMPGLKD